MKTVLVGCGKIADAHVQALGRLSHLTSIVAVCDREPLMAEQLARRFSIARHYTDFQSMLARERPDAVHITAPPAAHLALGRQALSEGCHLYVEKPLTTSRVDDEALLEAARASSKKLAIGYTYAFDPVADALRDAVASGRLGTVVHAQSVYGYDLGGDYGTAASKDGAHWVRHLRGGLLRNSIDHLLHELAEWLPDPSPRVMVLGAMTPDRALGSYDVHLLVGGRERSGSGMFSCSARPALHRVTLFGTKDTATADFHNRTLTLASSGVLRSALGRAVSPFVQSLELARGGARNLAKFAMAEFGFFEGMVNLMRRFYEAIANGTAPPIPYDRIAWISRVTETVLGELESQGTWSHEP